MEKLKKAIAEGSKLFEKDESVMLRDLRDKLKAAGMKDAKIMGGIDEDPAYVDVGNGDWEIGWTGGVYTVYGGGIGTEEYKTAAEVVKVIKG